MQQKHVISLNVPPLSVKVLLFCLFVVGMVLRLHVWRSHDKFAGDEGIQLMTAEHLIRFGEWPKTGEISGLDSEDVYIFHNGAIGLLIQTLIYVVGLMNPEGYTLVFVLISAFQIGLLYVIGSNLFNWRVGLIAAILGSLSPTLIGLADWTSQPMLSLYGVTFAFALMSFAQRNNRFRWWLFGVALSFVSIQFYPPSWLLLPFMAYYHWHIWKTTFSHRVTFALVSIMWLLLLMASSFYLWKLEFTPYANIPMLRDFLGRIQFSLPNMGDFGSRFISILNVFIKVISLKLVNWRWLYWILWCVSVGLLLFKQGLSASKKIMVPFMVVFLYTLLVLGLVSLDRHTYLYPVLSVWIIGMAGLLERVISLFKRWGTRIYPVFIVILILLMAGQFRLDSIPETTRLERDRNVISFILATARRQSIPLEKIELYVVTQNDKWNWEASLYWYLLEKEVSKLLVRLNPETSKVVRLSASRPSLEFLICEDTYIDYLKDSNSDFNCFFDYMSAKGNRLDKTLVLRDSFIGDKIAVYAYYK